MLLFNEKKLHVFDDFDIETLVGEWVNNFNYSFLFWKGRFGKNAFLVSEIHFKYIETRESTVNDVMVEEYIGLYELSLHSFICSSSEPWKWF